MELLSKTTVRSKSQGSGLSAKDVNSINDTVNSIVDVINTYLMKYCDINIEDRNDKNTYTLAEAIQVVPTNRRSLGMKIKFLGNSGNYCEYVFRGPSVSNLDWEDENNWTLTISVIDGGEFTNEN